MRLLWSSTSVSSSPSSLHELVRSGAPRPVEVAELQPGTLLFVLQPGEHFRVAQSGELGGLFEYGVLCALHSGRKAGIGFKPVTNRRVRPVCGPSCGSLASAVC